MESEKKRIIFFVYILIGLLFCEGCTSTRYVSSKKHTDFSSFPTEIKFNIKKAAIDNTSFFSPISILDPPFATDKLMKTAIKLYPDYFSQDSSALPIEVEGTIKYSNNALEAITYNVLTLTVYGGIIPLKKHDNYDLSLGIRFNDNLSGYIKNQNDDLKIETESWISIITPLGLREIPGPSDEPKDSSLIGHIDYEKALELARKSIIYSVIDSINKMDNERLTYAYSLRNPRANYTISQTKDIDQNFQAQSQKLPVEQKFQKTSYDTAQKTNPDTSNTEYSRNLKRLSLLIGNAEYIFGGRLKNSVNDVRAVQNALTVLGFDVIIYENCDQKTMKIAIGEFGQKLKDYDVGLFFYAGHGVQVDGSNYLIPVDANLNSKNDVELDCVKADRVLAKMEDAGSNTNIVILDACRDNPFERSWRRSSKGSGLAFMNAPSGSLIAYSTSPGTTALDGTGANSVYTEALLKHFNTRGITILEMFQNVRGSVIKETNNQQVPWESTSLRGNFYFKMD